MSNTLKQISTRVSVERVAGCWFPATTMSLLAALYEWSVIGLWGSYNCVLYAYKSLFFDETNYVEDMDISKIAKNLIKSVASGEVGI